MHCTLKNSETMRSEKYSLSSKGHFTYLNHILAVKSKPVLDPQLYTHFIQISHTNLLYINSHLILNSDILFCRHSNDKAFPSTRHSPFILTTSVYHNASLIKRKTKIIIIKIEITICCCFLARQENTLAAGLYLQHQVNIIYIWNHSFCINHCTDCSTNKLRKDFMTLSEHCHLILKRDFTSKWWFRFYFLISVSAQGVFWCFQVIRH